MLDWDAYNQAAIRSFRHASDNSETLDNHRFINPSVAVEGDSCTCGWNGPAWGDHILRLIPSTPVADAEKPEVEAKPAPRKRTPKPKEG